MSFTTMTLISYIFPPPGLGIDEPFVAVEEFDSTPVSSAKEPSLSGSVLGGSEKHAKSTEMQV